MIPMSMSYRLLFIGLLVLAAALPVHAKRVALVIGNSAYKHDKVLPNPRNDADGMAKVLKRLGFEVTQGEDLDKIGMQRTMLEFGRKTDGAEIAVVYYAGHGLEASGKNYLLPVDARLPDELALRIEAIDLELLLEAMAPARTRLLFLDACRNNPLANNMRMRTAGRNVGRGLGRVDAVSNTLIAYATEPGAIAEDGQGRNSPFAKALIANLERPGLEIQQIMREVRREVAQATQNRQVPWESSQLFDAVVLKPSAGTQVASVTPERTGATQQQLSNSKKSVGVPLFAGPPELARTMQSILIANLKQSSQLNGISFAGDGKTENDTIDPASYSTMNIDYLILGSIRQENDKLYIAFRYWDIKKAKELGGVGYHTNHQDLRLTAHKITDDIIGKSSSTPSFFSSRAADIVREGNKYNLAISDHDENGSQTALTSPEPILNPIVSKNDKYLLYVSYEGKKPDLYLHEVNIGRRNKLKNINVTDFCPKIEHFSDETDDRWTRFHWNSPPTGKCFQALLSILNKLTN